MIGSNFESLPQELRNVLFDNFSSTKDEKTIENIKLVSQEWKTRIDESNAKEFRNDLIESAKNLASIRQKYRRRSSYSSERLLFIAQMLVAKFDNKFDINTPRPVDLSAKDEIFLREIERLEDNSFHSIKNRWFDFNFEEYPNPLAIKEMENLEIKNLDPLTEQLLDCDFLKINQTMRDYKRIARNFHTLPREIRRELFKREGWQEEFQYIKFLEAISLATYNVVPLFHILNELFSEDLEDLLKFVGETNNIDLEEFLKGFCRFKFSDLLSPGDLSSEKLSAIAEWCGQRLPESYREALIDYKNNFPLVGRRDFLKMEAWDEREKYVEFLESIEFTEESINKFQDKLDSFSIDEMKDLLLSLWGVNNKILKIAIYSFCAFKFPNLRLSIEEENLVNQDLVQSLKSQGKVISSDENLIK